MAPLLDIFVQQYKKGRSLIRLFNEDCKMKALDLLHEKSKVIKEREFLRSNIQIKVKKKNKKN